MLVSDTLCSKELEPDVDCSWSWNSSSTSCGHMFACVLESEPKDSCTESSSCVACWNDDCLTLRWFCCHVGLSETDLCKVEYEGFILHDLLPDKSTFSYAMTLYHNPANLAIH